MKTTTRGSMIILVLTAFATLSGTVSLAQLETRAPDILPGTLPEMRETSYWIDRMDNPDEIVLSQDQIAERNRRFRHKVASPSFFASIPEERKSKLMHYFPGISLYPFDLDALETAAWPDSLRYHFDIGKEYLTGQPFGNSNGVEYSEKEIQTLIDEMAGERIGDYPARCALTVRMTRLKNAPAFFPAMIGLVKNAGRTRFDLWSIGILKIARPLIVLHLSKSGEFAFVRCDIGFGWVRADDIAFCDEEDFEQYTTGNDFIVCTGDRVQFYTDENCTVSSGWFGMSARLPAVSASDPRKVTVPLRMPDGTLASSVAWLKRDADVSMGWLPYTRRNIVTTAFKLLDNPYDFTGTFFGRQHESTYRDIFGCFGFELPYHGGMFTHYGDDSFTLDPEIGREGQYSHILGREPFVTVMITLQDRGGHCQLFLGGHEGVPIVFDQHGYGYTDENGKELIIRRCCVDDITMPEYFLKRKLTFLVLK